MSVALAIPSLAAEWDKITVRLRADMDEDAYKSWCMSIRLEQFNGAVLVLSVPTLFLRRHLEKHYAAALLTASQAVLGNVTRIVLRVRQPQAKPALVVVPSPEVQQRKQIANASATGWSGCEGSPLEERYAFSTFHVCSANRLAHLAAVRIAETSAGQSPQCNPLYLYGKAGLGKTHLLQAIAWQAKRRRPTAKVLYLSAARFLSSFATASDDDALVALIDAISSADICLLDDVASLQHGASKTAFRRTLNALIERGKQVVVAAKCAAIELDGFDDHTRYQLVGGVAVEIGPLDYGVRYSILQRLVARYEWPNLKIGEPVLAHLAANLPKNGRALEGAINRLNAAYQADGGAMTVGRAAQLVSDMVPSPEPRHVTVDDIMRAVVNRFSVTKVDLLSDRRDMAIVRPRQIGMFLARTLTSSSMPYIGRRFGGRDHTTVLHAIRKITKLQESDTALAEDIATLTLDLQYF